MKKLITVLSVLVIAAATFAQTTVDQKTLAYTLENAQKKSLPILATESENAISAELGR